MRSGGDVGPAGTTRRLGEVPPRERGRELARAEAGEVLSGFGEAESGVRAEVRAEVRALSEGSVTHPFLRLSARDRCRSAEVVRDGSASIACSIREERVGVEAAGCEFRQCDSRHLLLRAVERTPEDGASSAEVAGGSLERGTPGRSADAEYRRRRAGDSARRRQQFGPFAWVVSALAGERQETRAWSTGAEGERRVGAELERALSGRGIVLHDRRLGPRANIDHLVVAPSGVWVVDAKKYHGAVQARDVGRWLRRDVRLYVGRRDRSGAIDGVQRQCQQVEAALLDDFGAYAPATRGAICLVGSEWPWLARPLRIGGVVVTWPRRLGRLVREPGPLDHGRIQRVAGALAVRFPVR